ncbi:MAG: hypothetical protein GY741_11805, partial [Phycisphaeraceae bacterium]|nr:hypothetical protein [Phycisphaeraceae bacterium]
ELDFTGLLETVEGSISFNVGEFGDLKGSIKAGGAGSDVILWAGSALIVRGDIQADRHIELATNSAGLAHTEFSTRMQQSQGISPPDSFLINNLLGGLDTGELVSVFIDSTASLGVTGVGGVVDRHIHVTGNDHVVVNGTLGDQAGDLAEIMTRSTSGDLYIAKDSGRLESDASLILQGTNVNLYGVVKNSAATAGDWEIDITATDTATVTGDLSGHGSIRITAGSHVAIYDTDVTVLDSGERFKIDSGGTVKLGEVGIDFTDPSHPGGKFVNLGSVINAPGQVIIESVGKTTVSTAVAIAASADHSQLSITAGELEIVGSLYGGAGTDGDTVTWTGESADVTISSSGPIKFGAFAGGYDDEGDPESRAGSIAASGVVTITTTATAGVTDLELDYASSITTDATAAGALTGSDGPSSIDIDTLGDIMINDALIAAADPDSAVNIDSSSGLITLDGIIRADDTVSIRGGSDANGDGLMVTALTVEEDAGGHPYTDRDASGEPGSGEPDFYSDGVTLKVTDADGFQIDPVTGDYLDDDGVVTATRVYGGVPIRLSGGSIETGVE